MLREGFSVLLMPFSSFSCQGLYFCHFRTRISWYHASVGPPLRELNPGRIYISHVPVATQLNLKPQTRSVPDAQAAPPVS